MADDLKKKHALAYPDYQYQPRKPSEKKRRMTRRKLDILNNAKSRVITSVDGSPAAEEAVLNQGEEAEALPEFDRTYYGNISFDLGSEDVDNNTFKAMLEKHNASIDSTTNQASEEISPVLFNEVLASSQNDDNFFSSIVNYDKCSPTDDEIVEKLEEVTKDAARIERCMDFLKPKLTEQYWDKLKRGTKPS